MPAERSFRALLVDYGGVMTSSMGRMFAQFCLEAGIDPSVFKDVIAEAYGADGGGGMVARLERGEIPTASFDSWLADRLSRGATRRVDPEGIRDRLFAALAPDDRMVEALRRAHRAGIRTALVSNNWGDHEGYEGARVPDLFDVVVVSGEVGARKPEPRIYLLTAERLGVTPETCVFVDDLLQNVEGARAVGMEGIVHRNAEFTIPKLEALLGVPLSD
jgi:putative hydrolase of the HAD superfamily